ncbi:preprotein translocase subunit SecG [Desulfovibrio ferrophilus]|uniref:Protein-export membrane protein SecG n=1 Tax=Desulfovibrio ferrophilus TaxID=241368 RepID=A0A2Z6AWQ0_9BACT|nr:preprotein translocase subunit SecG [Desulfovibrio ferrophilus]BBD07651.1 preprotein translocase subunit SecG [Desulfovibrio ferrophilus]
MEALVLTLHIIACLILIVLVLLQSGKEGMGVIFGGGSSTVFGSSGAGGLLTKLTAFLAATFLVTSLVYNVLISSKPSGDSIMTDDIQIEETAAPVAPVQPQQGVDDIGATPSEPAGSDDLAKPEGATQ